MIDVVKIELDMKVLEQFARNCDMSVDSAVKAVAYQTEGLAKNRAPVDTGALKSSIHVSKDGEMQYTVGDGVDYGIYQELGTSKMAAHPFLIPSLRKAVGQLYEAVEKEFSKVLK